MYSTGDRAGTDRTVERAAGRKTLFAGGRCWDWREVNLHSPIVAPASRGDIADGRGKLALPLRTHAMAVDARGRQHLHDGLRLPFG